jgi:hypothetical protein
MNVIDYITITCNLKNGQLQIPSDYMKKCNRLQLITITNYDYPMSVMNGKHGIYLTNNVECRKHIKFIDI